MRDHLIEPGVQQVQSVDRAFAAILAVDSGGDSSAVADQFATM